MTSQQNYNKVSYELVATPDEIVSGYINKKYYWEDKG